MASPRSMWSGSIELGLLNIPITIGKAASEQREQSLIEVAVHPDGTTERILRNEHVESGKDGWIKRHAVATDDGFRVMDEDEFAEIEAATKTPTLVVVDVQPVSKLPLLYSNGAYYVRHDSKSKVAPTAMATLVATMMTERLALICKWGNSSRQKLCVLSAESGILILRQIPFLDDVRVASAKEREHMRVKVEPKAVEKMGELLSELQNSEGFDYASYHDEGLRLRQEAVDRILKGEKIRKAPPKQEIEEQIDIFEAIDRAMVEAKKDKVKS